MHKPIRLFLQGIASILKGLVENRNASAERIPITGIEITADGVVYHTAKLNAAVVKAKEQPPADAQAQETVKPHGSESSLP